MKSDSGKKASKTQMPHIPNEIIGLILWELPVKSLVRFQCVCKEWRSMIQDHRGRRLAIVRPKWSGFKIRTITDSGGVKKEPLFSDRLALFDMWDIKMEGLDSNYWSRVWCSCNGLVLCSVLENIFLCNLWTRCYTKVLELRGLNEYWDHYAVSGLCYVSSTRDYKAVLLLDRYDRPSDSGYSLVASLRNKKWYKVSFPYDLNVARDGFEFNGTLHWRVIDSDKEWHGWNRWNKIVYFDPECDEFKELPTPEPRQGEEENAIVGLGIIDDCLCMARSFKGTKEEEEIEVLVMKEYNIKESWVSKFVMSTSTIVMDCRNMKLYSAKDSSKVLIWTYEHDFWLTSDYNVKENKREVNDGKHGSEGPVGICSYVQSVVSPNEFVWRDDLHKHLAEFPEN